MRRCYRRLIAGLLVGSSVSVAALAPGAWSHGVLRFVPVFCIAPVFPIVVARIALAGPACLPLSAMRGHVPAVSR